MGTSRKIKLLHIVEKVGPSIIPFEVAQKMAGKNFQVVVVVYENSKEEVKDYKQEEVEVIGLEIKNRLNLNGPLQLYRTIKEQEPDIIHTHHNFSGSIGRVAGKLAGVPVIVDSEHSSHRGQNFLGCFLNCVTLRLADKVICNSEFTKKSFYRWENIFWPTKKAIFIHNGVDVREIRDFREDQFFYDHFFQEHTPVICNVAMTRPIKNQERLIEAFERIIKKLPKAGLVIVGEGKTKDRLERITAEKGLEGSILFTGLVERKMVYSLLKRSDLFVLTSLSEGFCNALVEAMVSSLPVAVSDIPPLRKTVGELGVYFSPRDIEEMVEKIIDLLEKPKKREELGRSLRQRAINNFSLEKQVKEYKEVYLDLLDKKGLL